MDFPTLLDQTTLLAANLAEDELTAFARDWDATQSALPAGQLFFLQPDYVAAAYRAAGFSPEVAAATTTTAAGRIEAAPALRALAWHCYRCLYHASEYPSELIRRWPRLDGALQAHAGLFYVLVLLSNTGWLRDFYAAHDIPDRVLHDTLWDVQRWMPEHYEERGSWGLRPAPLTWLRNHLRAELFHLVRLQFQPGRFQPGAIVFRHRTTRQVLALSENGVRYRADGQLDAAGGVFDADNAWTARLERDGAGVRGFPIVPDGHAVRREVYLPDSEWQQALAPGDPVLHLHIPAGSPMDFERCGRSLRAALDFFPRHLPEHPFAAFACSSWLLDGQFAQFMPPTSNVVRFQQEVYLLPARSDGRSALERVFGRVPTDLTDPQQAPRDTTMRRALVDHLLGGGHLRGGRCFLLPEDLDWGKQIYRRSHLVNIESTIGESGENPDS